MQSSPVSRKRRLRLLTLGDLALDVVLTARDSVALGSDVTGKISFRLGGSAANTARSIAALGGDAIFVGAVGADRLGRRVVRELRAAGVRPRVRRVEGASTARIAVIVSPGGERSFITSRGAADSLAPGNLRRSWFRGVAALHLPAYSLLAEPLASAARLAAEWAHAGGAIVSVDLASSAPLLAAGPGVARASIASVGPDILFANSDEVAALGGVLDDVAPVVVIKLGSAGARVGEQLVPTQPLTTTDTTGAGDAFDAGFLFGWLGEPGNGESAARAGNAAAVAYLTGTRPELDL